MPTHHKMLSMFYSKRGLIFLMAIVGKFSWVHVIHENVQRFKSNLRLIGDFFVRIINYYNILSNYFHNLITQ